MMKRDGQHTHTHTLVVTHTHTRTHTHTHTHTHARVRAPSSRHTHTPPTNPPPVLFRAPRQHHLGHPHRRQQYSTSEFPNCWMAHSTSASLFTTACAAVVGSGEPGPEPVSVPAATVATARRTQAVRILSTTARPVRVDAVLCGVGPEMRNDKSGVRTQTPRARGGGDTRACRVSSGMAQTDGSCQKLKQLV
jgi:hypothetical protein